MKDLLKQFVGLAGAGFAAACCLGLPLVLSAAGAVGAGFLIRDAYLFPLFVGFVALSLWFLYRSARGHEQLLPLWLGFGGAALGTAGLFLLVTGLYPHSYPVYAGLLLLVAGSVWDLVNGRRAVACAKDACALKSAPQPAGPSARLARGAALSVAAAAAFYGMYKTVDTLAPKSEGQDIACFGINSCKGQSACTTAWNSCTHQNSCKGKGFLYASVKACALKGGEPLDQSPADPRKGTTG